MKLIFPFIIGALLTMNFTSFAQNSFSLAEIYDVKKMRSKFYDEKRKEMSSWGDWDSPYFWQTPLKVNVLPDLFVFTVKGGSGIGDVEMILKDIVKYEGNAYYTGSFYKDNLDGEGEVRIGWARLFFYNNSTFNELTVFGNREYHVLIKLYRLLYQPIMEIELFIDQ